jgi:hypothetical protein
MDLVLARQAANEELRVCALIRPAAPSGGVGKDTADEDAEAGRRRTKFPSIEQASNEDVDDGDKASQEHGGAPHHESAQDVTAVRCAAVRVLASLIAGERVKARRCLCRLAEGKRAISSCVSFLFVVLTSFKFLVFR